MKYNCLGKTQLKVSEISLGCWALGGLNWSNGHANGWANVEETDIQQAVDYALEQGVNHFDNADVYGNGTAERLLAKVLGKRSSQVIIASKVGHFKGTAAHAYEPLHIRQQCEQSLLNLKRDYLDIYYFHHGNFGPADCYLPEAVAMMRQLQQEGKIRVIGLSAYSTQDFLRLVPVIKPEVIQSWAHIMDDKFIAEKTLVRQLMEKEQISFIAFSPLNQGVLLDKYSAANPPQFANGDHRSQSPKFGAVELAALAPRLRELKQRFGDSTADLARVALQYVLYHPVVASVIPGFRNLQQVQMNLAASGQPLTAQEFLDIQKIFQKTTN
jgi:aryl-alcohol dehydrogenase-like predicted oxidoreductase